MPIIYLVPNSRAESIDLPSELGEQPSSLGIHGLSARKVYLAAHVTICTVSSYLTFSPFPHYETKFVRVVFLSVALSVAEKSTPSR